MGAIKKMISKLIGHVPLDDVISFGTGSLLLHISDTPSHFYPELKRILDSIKPDYIVHTGDFVDNVKLGLHPSLIQRYERELGVLMGIMNQCTAKRILFILGNHDDITTVEKFAGKVEIYDEGGQSAFEGVEIAFTHYASDLARRFGYEEPEFCLFGHDVTLKSQEIENKIFLNGIEAMHMIDLSTGDYIELEYPMGTESARLNRHRIGI